MLSIACSFLTLKYFLDSKIILKKVDYFAGRIKHICRDLRTISLMNYGSVSPYYAKF